MTQTDKILAHKEAGVGIVTFNNPERLNAVSLEMWEAAKRALDGFAADPEVRVVVLTGAGGKAFVSGADISKFGSERATLEATRAYDVTTAATFNGIYEFPKPTIAMIRGYCIGGGLALASVATCVFAPTIPGSRFRRRSLAWVTVMPGSSAWSMWSGRPTPRRFSTPRASSTRRKLMPWVSSTVWCRRPSWKAR